MVDGRGGVKMEQQGGGGEKKEEGREGYEKGEGLIWGKRVKPSVPSMDLLV